MWELSLMRRRPFSGRSGGSARPVSAATKANKQLRQRSQRHYVKGERVWDPVQRGPPTADRDATAARLMAEEEAAKAAYYQGLHLLGFSGVSWEGCITYGDRITV